MRRRPRDLPRRRAELAGGSEAETRLAARSLGRYPDQSVDAVRSCTDGTWRGADFSTGGGAGPLRSSCSQTCILGANSWVHFPAQKEKTKNRNQLLVPIFCLLFPGRFMYQEVGTKTGVGILPKDGHCDMCFGANLGQSRSTARVSAGQP